MTETEDYAGETTPAAHKTTHQDGGSDEVSIAGLSGEAAAEQKSAWAKVSGKPTTFVPVAHKVIHENGGPDQVSIAGLSGEATDEQKSAWAKVSGKPATFSPAAHKASHQNGGADKISIAGLSGEATDEQKSAWAKVSGKPTTFDPAAHKASHQNGGGDELSVAGLSGVLAEDQHVIDAEAVAAAKTVKLDDFAAPDDNTDLNASTLKHGLLKKLDNVATNFLSGEGAWAVPAGSGGGGTPNDYITGFILSNDTDTEHDINVTPGTAMDATNTEPIELASEITKRIDAAWAVGDDAGGLDTGSVAASTLYAVWLIKRSDTNVEDVLISASFSAPTMPADYDYKRWIGYVLTDGDSDIIPFRQTGKGAEVNIWPNARLNVATGLSETSYTTQSLTGVLPTGKVLEVLLGGYRPSGSAGVAYVLISDDGTNAKTIFAITDLYVVVGDGNELYQSEYASPIFAPVNANTAIYYKLSGDGPMSLLLRAAKIQR